MSKTDLRINKSYVGETIENKVRRVVENKEPIKDAARLIYTERKDGVRPDYDIRTDRFDVAIEATGIITKSKQAKRDERIKGTKVDNPGGEKKEGADGGAESTQTTK